ncbi:hypothetical protein [Haladaptatus pallidirubidus]
MRIFALTDRQNLTAQSLVRTRNVAHCSCGNLLQDIVYAVIDP